jgi:hypothetical protein
MDVSLLPQFTLEYISFVVLFSPAKTIREQIISK